ncbi:MAG: NifU family protein [Bacilli bacterium]|nr:NifU family protein [Bacilli bacterium]MDD3305086.1 NifU family protein [Bacilli bacterium]MDD4053450.1 NifU family protein [Bacilli bacterium]MDD4410903.1 NifU family protein [Bacilli bacterium]
METVDRIKEVLDTIRPFLESDGGDVEFVSFEDGIVYLKLLGACSNCNRSDMTLEGVIQEALTFEIPEVIKVVNIGE